MPHAHARRRKMKRMQHAASSRHILNTNGETNIEEKNGKNAGTDIFRGDSRKTGTGPKQE